MIFILDPEDSDVPLGWEHQGMNIEYIEYIEWIYNFLLSLKSLTLKFSFCLPPVHPSLPARPHLPSDDEVLDYLTGLRGDYQDMTGHIFQNCTGRSHMQFAITAGAFKNNVSSLLCPSFLPALNAFYTTSNIQ